MGNPNHRYTQAPLNGLGALYIDMCVFINVCICNNSKEEDKILGGTDWTWEELEEDWEVCE